ncbi:MAG: hypothetical protein AAF170_03670 [Bacteroidota bacterium]
MSTPSVRVLFVSIEEDSAALAESVRDSGLAAEIDCVSSVADALEIIQNGLVDVCFAPSTAGPDASASLTLALARVGAYVPVIAVVDELSAGFEAIADEGAADFVGRSDLSPQSVGRALLVAVARAEAVTRFQSVQADRDAVLVATGSVVVTLNAEGRLVDLRASPSLQSDFGEAASGARFASLFSSDARAGAVDALRQAHGGRAGRFIQMRARAGRPLMLYWTVARAGSGFRAVGVDRSEASREASREAYRADFFRVVLETILDQAPITAFVVDAEGAFLLTMGQEMEGLGMQGVSFFEAYRDKPRMIDNVLRALDGEVFTDILTLSGARRFEAHYTPFSLGVNEAFGVLCVTTELTERTLRPAERSRLEAVLRLSQEAVVMVDGEGSPIFLSPALREIVGYTALGLRTEGGVARLFADPSQRAEIARSVRGGDPWSGQAGLRTASGRIMLFGIEAHPVFDAEGMRIGGIARLIPV